MTALRNLIQHEDGLSTLEFAGFLAVSFTAGFGMLYVGAATLMTGFMPTIKL